MRDNLLNTTYVYKREHYTDNAERIIKIPLGIFKSRKGIKNVKKRFNILADKDDIIDKEKLRTSISRTKRNIRRLALSNDFEYFATWTISSEFADRFSVDSVESKMKYLLKEYQRHNKNFKYLYICEKHKDGALHFHGLVKGMQDLELYKKEDFEKLPYYIIDTIEKGKKIYHCPYFDDKLGYNTFTQIKNYSACCNYILKYISKDPVINENNQVYFCSRGLIKCISEDYLTDIPDVYFTGSYKHYYDSVDKYGKPIKLLLCEVKDIYIDSFNKSTKLDYIIDTLDKDNYI